MTIANYPQLAIGKNAFELFFQVSAACKPPSVFSSSGEGFFLFNSGERKEKLQHKK
jgi:hypothetical protein